MHVAGIDPGKTGGYGILTLDGKLVSAGRLEFDNPNSLFDALRRYDVQEILLERAQGAAGQANQFEYGRSFGRTEAACMLSGAEIFYCAPAWWKSRLNVPTDKSRAYWRACERWPVLEFLAPPGDRGGLDAVHGVAEAVLIGSVLTSQKLHGELTKNNAARIKRSKRRPKRFDWKGD